MDPKPFKCGIAFDLSTFSAPRWPESFVRGGPVGVWSVIAEPGVCCKAALLGRLLHVAGLLRSCDPEGVRQAWPHSPVSPGMWCVLWARIGAQVSFEQGANKSKL